MTCYRIVILLVVFCLVPASGYAKVYRYIDKDGVERFSNQPPPEGAKIIEETQEVGYDKAADNAQKERNRKAAAEAAAQPAPQPTVKPAQPAGGSAPKTEVYNGDRGATEKKYSRRKHRRKKEIRKENAEMRKAIEAAEQPVAKPAK